MTSALVFLAIAVAGGLTAWRLECWRSRRSARRAESGTEVVPPTTETRLPPVPRTPVLVSDRPIRREDLFVVAVLLSREAHAWMNQAYAAVLAQVAEDEAAVGVDDVERAANEGGGR